MHFSYLFNCINMYMCMHLANFLGKYSCITYTFSFFRKSGISIAKVLKHFDFQCFPLWVGAHIMKTVVGGNKRKNVVME